MSQGGPRTLIPNPNGEGFFEVVSADGPLPRPEPPELQYRDDPDFRAFRDALGRYVKRRSSLTLSLPEFLGLVNENPEGARLYFDRIRVAVNFLPEGRVRPVRQPEES